MSKRDSGLHTVARVFESQERQLRRQLVELDRQIEAARNQLDDLVAYRQTESERASPGPETGPARLVNQQQFLTTLNAAITQQQVQIAAADRDREEVGRRWLELRRRHRALENLLDQREAAERAALERRLQKESDERACQQYSRPDASQ